MIRLVIADDMREIQQYLSEILGREEDFEIVGAASSGAQALALAQTLLPDAVLMDIQMESRMAGITAIEKLHQSHPEIKCIVLTIHADDEYLFRAYMAGASDFIVKTRPPEEIVQVIRAVIQNDLLLRPEVVQRLVREYQRIQSSQSRMRDALQVMLMISTTEYEVLKLIYHGYTYKNIAQLRYVQETTIRVQVNHILKKFGKKRMKDVISMLRDLNIFEEE